MKSFQSNWLVYECMLTYVWYMCILFYFVNKITTNLLYTFNTFWYLVNWSLWLKRNNNILNDGLFDMCEMFREIDLIKVPSWSWFAIMNKDHGWSSWDCQLVHPSHPSTSLKLICFNYFCWSVWSTSLLCWYLL